MKKALSWLFLLSVAIVGYSYHQRANMVPVANAADLEHSETIVVGMGCFWGAEKRMGSLPGIISTEVGYAGGDSPSPTYEKVQKEAHSGQPSHAEVVKITFDTSKTSLEQVLKGFWENHNPTQGNRQGNDVGPNYRSAVYFSTDQQKQIALQTKDAYQQALTKAGYGKITTEIVALKQFYPAEDYHQHYLQKNPLGYCGLGGTGVLFPGHGVANKAVETTPLMGNVLAKKQLVVFEAESCPFCKQFHADVLGHWKSSLPITQTLSANAPTGWQLKDAVWATPTIVYFEDGKELSRYTGYDGNQQRYWKWVGQQLLTPAQKRVAYEKGTDKPFTGSLLDNHASGYYADPVTGQPLFKSSAKFNSGTGWPSFFDPVPGALIFRDDDSDRMHRVEVLSKSSGIHLGHVFDDGPPPTGKRYCINSSVLKFVPDKM